MIPAMLKPKFSLSRVTLLFQKWRSLERTTKTFILIQPESIDINYGIYSLPAYNLQLEIEEVKEVSSLCNSKVMVWQKISFPPSSLQRVQKIHTKKKSPRLLHLYWSTSPSPTPSSPLEPESTSLPSPTTTTFFYFFCFIYLSPWQTMLIMNTISPPPLRVHLWGIPFSILFPEIFFRAQFLGLNAITDFCILVSRCNALRFARMDMFLSSLVLVRYIIHPPLPSSLLRVSIKFSDRRYEYFQDWQARSR